LTQVDMSSGYFMFTAVVGLGFSVLGGYVCARMVRRNELRVATILALLITLGGVLMSGESTFDLGAVVGMNAVQFAAILLGGHLGRRRNLALAGAAASAE
jgi:MFS-type transporter involved in bile tolerance (Atg22 family)